MYDVFISYCSKNEKEATDIEQLLHNHYGLNPWKANATTISGSDNFREKIVQAMDESKIILLLLTEESLNSKWVKLEITRALLHNKKIYPLRLDNSSLDDLWAFKLGSTQISDATSDYPAAIEAVAYSIKKERNKQIELAKNKIDETVKTHDYQPHLISLPIFFFVAALGILAIPTAIINLGAISNLDTLNDPRVVLLVISFILLINLPVALVYLIYLLNRVKHAYKAGNPNAAYILSILKTITFRFKSAKKLYAASVDGNCVPALKKEMKTVKEGDPYVDELKNRIEHAPKVSVDKGSLAVLIACSSIAIFLTVVFLIPFIF